LGDRRHSARRDRIAPEERLAHTVHGLHIPDNILHLFPAGLDARMIPIAVGMSVVAIALLR
jgi:hypothetical protein